MKKHKKILIIVLIVLIPLMIYLFTPYFMADILTKKYGADFLSLYSENGFYNDIEYLKVFQYRNEKVKMVYFDKDNLKKKWDILNDDYAVVLYIEENHSSASLFIFYDVDGKWELSSWDVVWSYSGTADGFMWPYYL